MYMNNPLHTLVRWFAPHECLTCNTEGALLCHWCRSNIPHVRSACYKCGTVRKGSLTCPACQANTPLAAVYCRSYYESDVIKQFIWRLKFDRAQSAASEMAEMLLPSLNHLPAGTIVTYAPTAPSRIRQRGYDQSRLIARRLAQLAGLRYAPTLRRIGKADQIGANRATRHIQASASFVIQNPKTVAGQSIVIIDDIMTTGATLESAATVLREAGAQEVRAAVFAYTPAETSQAAPLLL